MAKSASFFTLRRGSTKSLTFQVYRGAQITKDRVSEVANPQTTPQMYQRMKLAIVAAAAARLKGLVNHSFEGVEYGWRSIQEFRRLNLEKSGGLQIGSYIPKGMADAGVANYLISKGSLQALDVAWDNIATDGSAINRPSVSSISFPTYLDLGVAGSNATRAQKWNAFVDAFLEEYGNDRFSEGDQITLLLQCPYAGDPYKWLKEGVSTASSDEDYNAQRRTGFVISRLILEKDNTDMISKWTFDLSAGTGSNAAKMRILSLTDKYIKVSSTSDEEENLGQLRFEGDSLVNNDVVFVQDIYVGCAAILSRKSVDGTTWQRSTQRILFNPEETGGNYNLCEYTYKKTGNTSTKYLNYGNTSTGILGNEVSL